MNVKKIIELIDATPALANDPAGLLAVLNSKAQKKRKPIYKLVGYTNLPMSIAEEHGGDATMEDVEAAIALREKKGKKK